MAKQGRIQKSMKGNYTASWKEGREPIQLALTPELTVLLTELARQKGMDFNEFVSMALEDHVMNKVELEDSIRTMVARAFEEELNRLTHVLYPHRTPRR